MILELRGEGRTSVKDGHVGFEEQVEEKEEVIREEVGNVATDSDSGVVVGEVGSWCDLAAGVGRSVSGVMALTLSSFAWMITLGPWRMSLGII